jgi:hypothetical protein
MNATRKKSATPARASKAGKPRTAGTADAPDLSRTPIDKIRLVGLPPRALIAPNFRVYELTRSHVADRQGICNDFANEQHLHAAIHLTRQVLQPLRDKFGGFTPNSVYRSQALERALKRRPSAWISTSQHTMGQACDVEIVGVPTLEVARWAAEQLPEFDQIICECYDPRKGPNAGWVHISLKPQSQGQNRRALLSYVADPASNRYVYVPGLQVSAA